MLRYGTCHVDYGLISKTWSYGRSSHEVLSSSIFVMEELAILLSMSDGDE